MQCLNTSYGRSTKGFTLVEVIVALIVLTSMLAVGAVFLARHDDQVANETVAGQMQRLGDAVSHYVDDNYATLSAGPTTAAINWAAVKPYLPAGIDQNTGNPIGTRYDGALRVVTMPGGNKRVDALIYTVPVAGASQPDVSTHSMKVAQIIGAGGLYLDHDNRNPGAAAKYWSSYGEIADQASMNGFFGTAPTAIGQIFYAPFMRDTSTYGPGTLAGDLLHRKATAGHPEWNRMETDIDMNGHKLNNVDTMAMQGAGAINGVNRVEFGGAGTHSYITQSTSKDVVVAPMSGTFIVSDGGSGTGSILAKGVHAEASVLSDADVEAKGEIKAGNDLYIGKHDKVAGTTCPNLGHVGIDSIGDVMICKDDGGGLVWNSVLTQKQFDHTYTGRQTWTSTGSGAGNSQFGNTKTHITDFYNSLDVPAFVTVSAGGVNDGSHARCAIFVYEANGGWTGNDFYPIAMQQVGMHNDHYNEGYLWMDNCSTSFMARPHSYYTVTSLNGSDATFSYTY